MTDLFFLFIILQCCLFLLFIYLFITKSLYFNSSKLLNHSISAWDGYQQNKHRVNWQRPSLSRLPLETAALNSDMNYGNMFLLCMYNVIYSYLYGVFILMYMCCTLHFNEGTCTCQSIRAELERHSLDIRSTNQF